jgi:hypothetical protein
MSPGLTPSTNSSMNLVSLSYRGQLHQKMERIYAINNVLSADTDQGVFGFGDGGSVLNLCYSFALV